MSNIQKDSKFIYSKLMETMYTEGYIFGKDLDDYVLYTVRATPHLQKKYEENEIVEAILEWIYKKYEKTQIGICKECGNVKKTVRQWGQGFKYKTCLQCQRGIRLKEEKNELSNTNR